MRDPKVTQRRSPCSKDPAACRRRPHRCALPPQSISVTVRPLAVSRTTGKVITESPAARPFLREPAPRTNRTRPAGCGPSASFGRAPRRRGDTVDAAAEDHLQAIHFVDIGEPQDAERGQHEDAHGGAGHVHAVHPGRKQAIDLRERCRKLSRSGRILKRPTDSWTTLSSGRPTFSSRIGNAPWKSAGRQANITNKSLVSISIISTN